MITHVIDKGKFTNGLNMDKFKGELSQSSIQGHIKTIDDDVTHIKINGENDLNSTSDIKKINDVVADHDGSAFIDNGYGESDGESQTTSDNYQEKVKLTIPDLAEGDYLVSWSVEGKTTSDGSPVEIQIQVDDITIIGEPENSTDVFAGVGGFKRMSLLQGSHDFDMDFRSNQVGTNVKVRYARVRVRKY